MILWEVSELGKLLFFSVPESVGILVFSEREESVGLFVLSVKGVSVMIYFELSDISALGRSVLPLNKSEFIELVRLSEDLFSDVSLGLS